METDLDFEDFEDDTGVLVDMKERKRKKSLHDEKYFRSAINKKKLSKNELDELFLS